MLNVGMIDRRKGGRRVWRQRRPRSAENGRFGLETTGGEFEGLTMASLPGVCILPRREFGRGRFFAVMTYNGVDIIIAKSSRNGHSWTSYEPHGSMKWGKEEKKKERASEQVIK